MKKLFSSSQQMLVILLASITIISASSYSVNEAMAFPHASIIIESDEEHINPIELVLGHTNEPAYGKLPGIHDGKHNVEVELSDANTALPIQGGEEDPATLEEEPTDLRVDKYYFKDVESFQSAQSLEQADASELDAPLTPVFGQPGTFFNRQVIDPGIYGYTIKGVINYYNQGLVPVDVTKFCSIEGVDLTKFDSPEGGWQGVYGCPTNIKDIFFPPGDSSKYPYPPEYDDGYGNNGEGEY
jgi:hypothetical protein